MATPSAPLTFPRVVSLIGHDAPVILDIGANNGWHSSLFLKNFPQATLHAFEPDPRAARNFRQRIDDHRATLHEIALGKEDSEADFYMSDGEPPSDWGEYPEGFHATGSIRKPKNACLDWPWLRFHRSIRIKVMKLDSWNRLQNLERIDFIWADVQGAEGDLVDGGLETLSKTCLFYTEYSNREWYEGQVTLAQLAAKPPLFEIVAQSGRDVLFRNTKVSPPHGSGLT
jgi:FkbM family methyltransferase